MLGIGKKIALKTINQRIEEETVDNSFLKNRINPDKDFELDNHKIIFSKNVYYKILRLYFDAYRDKAKEYGTILYGRKTKNGDYYIDSFFSDLVSNGLTIELSKNNKRELTENTRSKYDVAIHFHVHPSYMHTPDGLVDNKESLRFSEQDLYLYGWLQKNYFENNNVTLLGMMSAVNYGSPTLSAVSYDKDEKSFYNITDIYTELDDKTIRINRKNILDKKGEELIQVVKSTRNNSYKK